MLKYLRSLNLIGSLKTISGLVLQNAILEYLNSRGRGWIKYVDNTRINSGTGQALTADTPSKILIDGAGASSYIKQVDNMPLSVWNTGTSKLSPQKVNDLYCVQVQFTFDPTGATSDNHITFDVKEDVNILHSMQIYIPKTDPHIHNICFMLQATSGSVSNGIEIYVTPDISGVLYGASIIIQRLSKGL